ncbi:MAG: hypothetical protein ACRYFX_17330 [Janthinobacterium lividum]
MLLVVWKLQTQAQPGNVGGRIAFRVFAPTGRLITPADSASFHIGFGDAAPGYFAGLHQIRAADNFNAAKPANAFYLRGFYQVEPPESHYGAPVTEAFRLFIARGPDTMFVYPPSIRVDQLTLDSIPFRPGTYYFTDFIYKTAKLVQPLKLRISPGPLTDWNALRSRVPIVYLEQVANFGQQAAALRYRRLYGWDSTVVNNGKTYSAHFSGKHPATGGLKRVATGPTTYYEPHQPILLQKFAQSGTLQLYRIEEAIDSARFFPRGQPASKLQAAENAQWREHDWQPPYLELDTIVYQQGAFYALGVRYFAIANAQVNAQEVLPKPQYGKFRLWRADELTPAQLARLRRNYLAQLAEAKTH